MFNLPKSSTGYTLLELMITLTVAGILMGVAVPSFTSVIDSNRLTTYANDLVTSLNFARSEAIKRNLRVSLCKSTTGSSCATSNNWAQGWIIFTDRNNNGTYESSNTLLRVQANKPNTTTMVGEATIADHISYKATGQSQLSSGAFQAGIIKICDERIGNVGINVVLNSVGRVSTQNNIACP